MKLKKIATLAFRPLKTKAKLVTWTAATVLLIVIWAWYYLMREQVVITQWELKDILSDKKIGLVVQKFKWEVVDTLLKQWSVDRLDDAWEYVWWKVSPRLAETLRKAWWLIQQIDDKEIILNMSRSADIWYTWSELGKLSYRLEEIWDDKTITIYDFPLAGLIDTIQTNSLHVVDKDWDNYYISEVLNEMQDDVSRSNYKQVYNQAIQENVAQMYESAITHVSSLDPLELVTNIYQELFAFDNIFKSKTHLHLSSRTYPELSTKHNLSTKRS